MTPALKIRAETNPELRAFLTAQLEWERYHVSRVRLVHALAAGGLCLWGLQALGQGLPEELRHAVLAAWALCFLAAGYTGMMERHWSRRRGSLGERLGR